MQLMDFFEREAKLGSDEPMVLTLDEWHDFAALLYDHPDHPVTLVNGKPRYFAVLGHPVVIPGVDEFAWSHPVIQEHLGGVDY